MNTKMFNLNVEEYSAPRIDSVQLFEEESITVASFDGGIIEDGTLEDWGTL